MAADKYGPQKKYKKIHTVQLMLNLQDTSGLPSALEEAIQATGQSKHAYGVDALKEKLFREGYWTEEKISSPTYKKQFDELVSKVDFDDQFWVLKKK